MGGGHYGYPYYGYYGKRSADAEAAPAPTADAKADPWVVYGHHGLGGYYGGYYGGYPYYPYYGYGHGYATTGASKKGVIKSRADGHEVPAFLTTTCPMFSISEKNQNVQNKTSSFFKHTAFKHLYILYIGTYGYLLLPLEPQERTRNVRF